MEKTQIIADAIRNFKMASDQKSRDGVLGLTSAFGYKLSDYPNIRKFEPEVLSLPDLHLPQFGYS